MATNLFDVLKHMAGNNMDVKRYDTVDSANATTKLGKITMRTDPAAVYQLGGIVGEQTHIPIFFMVDAKQYAEVNKLLDPERAENKAGTPERIEFLKETIQRVFDKENWGNATDKDRSVKIAANLELLQSGISFTPIYNEAQ